ncbi:MAG: AMP-binding protein [Peptococcaceae bacterium]|nr:AMP-binding protein [Peptococcaceae bacterium]
MAGRTPLDSWIAARTGSAPLTRGALAAWQAQKLRETVALARQESPFYRRHLGPFRAEDVTPADLPRLPFTTAADIADNPLRFLCVSQDRINRVVTLRTSGTTGPSKRLYFTAEDQELTRDFFHHGMSTLVGPGDRVLILMPGKLPGSVGDLLRESLARLGVEGVVHGFVKDPAEVLAILRRERIDALVGIPVQVLALARWPERDRPRLKSILLTTDHVPRVVTAELERLFQALVFNHYGMTEMGLGGGVECGARDGYHLREADLLFEIVDPVTGGVVRESEEGEIVFTTLTRAGMPLIRYRTGDLGRFVPGPCPCGTALKRMAPVRERVRGRIPLAGGGYISMAMLDEAVFAVGGVIDFQAVLTAAGGADRLSLRVQVSGRTDTTGGAVDRSLRDIPAVAANVAKGSLTCPPAEVECPRELARPAKRMIWDRR